jgi:ligand-binding sensor domain-containing protein
MSKKTNLYILSVILVFILRGGIFAQKRLQVPNGEVVLLTEKEVKINPYYVHFKNLTTADGFFGNGSYRFLAKDTLGYLWFWHDQEGLFRYNGRASVKFGDADGFFGREVRKAVVDKNGNLWFATINGLWQFDIKTGKFAPFINPNFADKAFVSINALPDGTLWLSTLEPNVCTWAFDPIKKRFLNRVNAVFTHPNNRIDSSSTLCVYGPIYVDRDSIAWFQGHISLAEGLCSIDLRRNQGIRYEMSQMFWRDGIHPEMTIQLNSITSISEDLDGNHLWMSGWLGGLRKYNKKTGRWTQYTAQNNQVNGFDTEMLLSNAQKSADELWVNGFSIFNKRTESYNVFPPNPAKPFSFRGEIQTTSIKSDDYQGYLATGTGVTHYSPASQRFEIRPLQIMGIAGGIGVCDDVQNVLLFPVGGSDKNPAPSIVKYNYLTKKTEQKFYPELLKAGTANPTIIKILRSKKGKRQFWVLTANGLFELNPTTLAVTRHPLSIKQADGQFLDLSFLCDMSEDTEGSLWITRSDYFKTKDILLIHYNPTTKALTTYSTNQPLSAHWFTFKTAISVFCDSKGNVWMGSGGTYQGLNILNPKTNEVKSYRCEPNDSTTLSHDAIAHFDEDAQGRVWLKTDGGFCFKTVESPTFQRVAGFKGNYHNFIFDKKGHIWVGNGKGLFAYDTLKRQWRGFEERHGIVSYANRIVINEDSSRIFVGGEVEFDPSVLEQKSPPPSIVIESFNVFDKPLPLPTLPHFAELITLNYDQNFFSIGFVGIGFQNPEETQYAYQLVGVEKDWVQSGTRNTAFYTNIGAGTYEFRVKAMNGDGVWSSVKTLKITVLPPFWQTWWFRLLAASLILGGLWFFYQYRLRQVRLEAAVQQKEAELLQKETEFRRSLAETEMSALRAQMNPHFIFNCLNSINNYMLDNDGKKASLYLTKFSRLIRLVLENSRTEKVTLDNEMAALELYIEMEALRYKHKLNYEIKIDPSVQMDFIEIPPLLVQPFVENAIWHGLMHRKEGGNLLVEVTQPQENTLRIEITDDGIGREAALALKSRSATRQKSFGMQITSERLQAINEIFGIQAHVFVKDLLDTEGGALGTKVIIEIPC